MYLKIVLVVMENKLEVGKKNSIRETYFEASVNLD